MKLSREVTPTPPEYAQGALRQDPDTLAVALRTQATDGQNDWAVMTLTNGADTRSWDAVESWNDLEVAGVPATEWPSGAVKFDSETGRVGVRTEIPSVDGTRDWGILIPGVGGTYLGPTEVEGWADMSVVPAKVVAGEESS